MKIRYHNRATDEIRDVEAGSAEETAVLVDTFTDNGVSKPQWVLESEWDKVLAERTELSQETAIFGAHHHRLTPGEIAMGITSYEQKIAENIPDDLIVDEVIVVIDESEADPEDEDDNETPDDDDEEEDDDDEEDDEDDPPAASTPVRRPVRRRTPAKR